MREEDPPQPPDLPERPQSEPLPEERGWTAFLGLPSLILVLAILALVKGIAEQNLGFAIMGAVVAVGVLLAIGYSMTIANREDRPPR
jgi:hypothetical protein